MQATIEVRELRKSFGPAVALDGMTFTVAPGQVTGFIGPNDAGKTTAMRVILGLDATDAGIALVGGHRYATLRNPLRQAGLLLDAAALQPGPFVTLPAWVQQQNSGLTVATAVFDHLSMPAAPAGARWRGLSIGANPGMGPWPRSCCAAGTCELLLAATTTRLLRTRDARPSWRMKWPSRRECLDGNGCWRGHDAAG